MYLVHSQSNEQQRFTQRANTLREILEQYPEDLSKAVKTLHSIFKLSKTDIGDFFSMLSELFEVDEDYRAEAAAVEFWEEIESLKNNNLD